MKNSRIIVSTLLSTVLTSTLLVSSLVTSSVLISSLAFTSTHANAETIKIGLSEQASTNKNINRPKMGMTMDKVVSYFGAPTQKSNPVGTPPIYKWTYTDFTVYFEGEYVINSVLHPIKQNKTESLKKSDEQP